MSQRSAVKRVKYDVDLSDEDADGDDKDADEDEDSGEEFQKLRRQPQNSAAAKKAPPLASQRNSASPQEAEPLDSGAGTATTAKRRLSMTAAGNGHLESVAEEEEKKTADEPGMTQKSSQKGSQKAQKQEVRLHPSDSIASYIATPHCMPVCKCCFNKVHAVTRV